MIVREIFIFVLVFAAFASAVAAYSLAFHGASTVKEVLSTAFTGTIGFYVGRYFERRLIRG
ncbi:hypothetical protein MB02_13560 [Croceicoccus estronivorus]|nr:hypothetical protein MB02_13560 [Croceicoccus estronivorus]